MADDFGQIFNDVLGENIQTSNTSTATPSQGSNSLVIGVLIVTLLVVATIAYFVFKPTPKTA